MSMLKTLRAAQAAQPEAPINIVNGDVQIVELIQGAGDVHAGVKVLTDTTPRQQGPRPKFKPVDPSYAASVVDIADDIEDYRPENTAPPSDNFDLVGDIDSKPKRNVRGGGRKRIYATNAERQKALRDRKKLKANA